jgi:hypothetical protein
VIDPASALSACESFYVIVGPAAAVLIGLQFVVMTLTAERRWLPEQAQGPAAGPRVLRQSREGEACRGNADS